MMALIVDTRFVQDAEDSVFQHQNGWGFRPQYNPGGANFFLELFFLFNL